MQKYRKKLHKNMQKYRKKYRKSIYILGMHDAGVLSQARRRKVFDLKGNPHADDLLTVAQVSLPI